MSECIDVADGCVASFRFICLLASHFIGRYIYIYIDVYTQYINQTNKKNDQWRCTNVLMIVSLESGDGTNCARLNQKKYE